MVGPNTNITKLMLPRKAQRPSFERQCGKSGLFKEEKGYNPPKHQQRSNEATEKTSSTHEEDFSSATFDDLIEAYDTISTSKETEQIPHQGSQKSTISMNALMPPLPKKEHFVTLSKSRSEQRDRKVGSRAQNGVVSYTETSTIRGHSGGMSGKKQPKLDRPGFSRISGSLNIFRSTHEDQSEQTFDDLLDAYDSMNTSRTSRIQSREP